MKKDCHAKAAVSLHNSSTMKSAAVRPVTFGETAREAIVECGPKKENVHIVTHDILTGIILLLGIHLAIWANRSLSESILQKTCKVLFLSEKTGRPLFRRHHTDDTNQDNKAVIMLKQLKFMALPVSSITAARHGTSSWINHGELCLSD